MNRKDFLKKSLQAGFCGCSALLGLDSLAASKRTSGLREDLWKRMQEGAKSPDWLKIDKAQSWIKNVLDHMDNQLDEQTKIKLLNACGRSCYLDAFGVADENKRPAAQAEEFLGGLEKRGFKVERSAHKIIVDFGYLGEQNPCGLSIKEGYCMCPIVESELPGLSPSYCNCSAGYVKEIFERYTGKTVGRVEVLESVRRGGKDCRFRVEIANQ